MGMSLAVSLAAGVVPQLLTASTSRVCVWHRIFRAMPISHVVQGAQRDTKVRLRVTGALCRFAVVAGVTGLTAGAGLISAGSALASNGSQPGNLILHPAAGATTLTPTWSTTTGCPVGYQNSAQVSAFHANGTFASRISFVVGEGNLTRPFGGQLDFKMALLLRFGSKVTKGQGSEWAVGCYTGAGGTGRVKWVQSTVVTLSSTGTSYSTSTPNGSTGSAAGASGTTSSGSGTQIEAALIAGACGLAIAVGGVAWYRRRMRTRTE